ncbi:MAG: magnesium transporter CorA family protein [Lachnospiraceae bacterium]|nr:magnesium transporter CorA family protein [Lachnospiraceae bacterium]
MIQIIKTSEGKVEVLPEIVKDSWIMMTDPTTAELEQISSFFQMDIDDLKAPLDEEERSRIEVEDNYAMILVDIPMTEERNGKDWYVTVPLGIYVFHDYIITVCLYHTPILEAFCDGRVKEYHSYMKTRFIYQMLYRNASLYLQYLRNIEKKSTEIEQKMRINQKNQELVELMELQKSLVYITTSLRSNEAVLEKLMRTDRIKRYPEDTELLEDVIIENKQAIEMANIYRDILNGTMDVFASIISNNLNFVMKFLTVVTIILAVPTLISGFYGMNVSEDMMPFAHEPYAFPIIVFISMLIALLVGWYFNRKK